MSQPDFFKMLEANRKQYMELTDGMMKIMSDKDPMACYISTLILNKLSKELMIRSPYIRNVNFADNLMNFVDKMAEEFARDLFDNMKVGKISPDVFKLEKGKCAECDAIIAEVIAQRGTNDPRKLIDHVLSKHKVESK